MTKFVHDFFDGQQHALVLHLSWNYDVDDDDAIEIAEFVFNRLKRVDPIFPEKPSEEYALVYAGLLRDAASCAQRIFAAKWGRAVGELSDDWPLSQKRFTDPFLIATQQEVAELEVEALEAEGKIGPLVLG